MKNGQTDQQGEQMDNEQARNTSERDWETSEWFRRWLELIRGAESPSAAC